MARGDHTDDINQELWGSLTPSVITFDGDEEDFDNEFETSIKARAHQITFMKKRFAKRRKMEKRNAAIVFAATTAIASIGVRASPPVQK